ncbi:MAG: hypothetical protein Q4D04_06465 [Clostridia bacterium]|nr:hypothetical protein [Clostridia bacterium]
MISAIDFHTKGLLPMSFTIPPSGRSILAPPGNFDRDALALALAGAGPFEGHVEICGVDMNSRPVDAKGHIAFIPANPVGYPEIKLSDWLLFVARVQGVPGRYVDAEISRVLDQLDLTRARNQRLGLMDAGDRFRADISQALIGDPEVLIWATDDVKAALTAAQNINDARSIALVVAQKDLKGKNTEAENVIYIRAKAD